jgi:predicted Fe-Mo cluster-binding NifX family protein/ferredoxin
MKIAVTSTGPALDDNVEARFGRCAYFLIIDTDTMQFEAIENPNIALGGGAGIQSAQLMSEKRVTAVLTGNCGPNAFNVFGQAGIQVIVGVSGPVRNAIEQFKAGAFSSASGPNVDSHFGVNAAPTDPMTTGQPMTGSVGQGGGMGRGMGMAAAMGMPSTGPAAGFPENAGLQNPEQELAALKQQAELLEQQKRQLNNRIAQLESGRKAVAVVDSEKCTVCGICADVCPVNAITIKEQAVVNPDVCTGCAACVYECPNAAIEITQRTISK